MDYNIWTFTSQTKRAYLPSLKNRINLSKTYQRVYWIIRQTMSINFTSSEKITKRSILKIAQKQQVDTIMKKTDRP